MMEVQEMRLADIRPYEKNPRRNDDAVDAVANSIREFGWKQPIVVDKDMKIIVGHTRYKAAKKLKCKTVPVVVADDPPRLRPRSDDRLHHQAHGIQEAESMTAYWDEESIIADILDGYDCIPAILDRHVPDITRMDRERAWKRVWVTIQESTRICENGTRKYRHKSAKGLNYRRRPVKVYTVREVEVIE